LKKNYYFISDLHLGLGSREKEIHKEKLLVKFLESIKNDAAALYILGDLFDYWFEYRRVIQKGYYRTFTAIHDLVESGVEVHYLIGNHDFMHLDFFENEIGVKLYQNPFSTELLGKKFFLSHGDGDVKNDYGYKILKSVLRNKMIQKIYSLIHPDLGIKIASSTSKTSRDYTEGKNYGKIDGLLETAKVKIDEGFDFVLFGHSHEKCNVEFKQGRYINLGTWLNNPCYGKFNSQNFEIIDWK